MTTDLNALTDARSAAAQEEWENYDFDTYVVEDSSGFEHEVGSMASNEWSRPVYYARASAAEAARENDEEVSTIAGHFVVRFQPGSAEVAETYAVCGGAEIGRRRELAAGPAL